VDTGIAGGHCTGACVAAGVKENHLQLSDSTTNASAFALYIMPTIMQAILA
jgi:hypothetical protein